MIYKHPIHLPLSSLTIDKRLYTDQEMVWKDLPECILIFIYYKGNPELM